jgi:hypothetical protein
MRRLFRSLLGSMAVAVASVAVIGQTPPAGGEKKAETPAAPGAANFFPNKKGTKWIYKNGENKIEMTIGDGNTLDTLVSGKKVASETIEVKPDGVYRTKVNGVAIEPAIKVLHLPLSTKDESWDVNSKLNAQEIKGKFTQKAAKEKFKLGTTELDAVVVDGPEFTIANAKCTIKQWFVDGKYVVKMVYSIAGNESMIELESFTDAK